MFSRFEENNDLSVSSAESVVLQSFSNFPRNLAPNFRLYIRDGHNNKQTKQAINNSASIKLKEEKEIKS